MWVMHSSLEDADLFGAKLQRAKLIRTTCNLKTKLPIGYACVNGVVAD